jgi:hypothetical protein
MRKRRGIQFPSFNPVTFAWECPKHPGELRLEYPVGQNAIFLPGASGNANITYESQRVYCPQAGGHTFNVEDLKATIFNDDGSVSAAGVPVNGSISASGLAIGSIYLA